MSQSQARLLDFRDLGRMAYAPAYELQAATVEGVLRDRELGDARRGVVFFVEHPPVITVSRRAGAGRHLLATPEFLRSQGVELAETDRGGDITYHGPGQLVVYPILDLNRLNLGLHAYMRLLEETVIAVCAGFGVPSERDPTATGVWTRGTRPAADPAGEPPPLAKICAMGVRVRKWVSMHGLALNVTTNLEHFRLIVPCGLVGRPVTTLSQILGTGCPSMVDVKIAMAEELGARVTRAAEEAERKRAAAGSG